MNDFPCLQNREPADLVNKRIARMADYILVVDDEPMIAYSLPIILRRAGYESSSVSNAEDALLFIAANPVSLLLTDVMMPGMDGISLAKKIRQSHPACKILLFSGNANTLNLMEASRKEGYNFEIMAKPMDPRDLVVKIASLLGQRDASGQ